MVSWFRPLHLWDIEMTTGFVVSWFHGFMVSSTSSLDDEKSTGFMVSWFRGFVLSVSGWREVDRFRGFVHSMSNPSLGH